MLGTPTSSRPRKRAGFTLVEFVVSIVLLGIVATIGAKFMSSMFSAYFESRDVTSGDWQGRVAFERITRELREIPSRTGLVVSPTTEITFVGSDGNTTRYYRASNVLRRQNITAGTDQPLADNATAITFEYLTNNGIATTATTASVCYVTAVLTIQSTSGTTTTFNDTLRATVQPRNFQPCP
jgi:prepilin-type N-terminal cleavage/methylation domain-containing protein